MPDFTPEQAAKRIQDIMRKVPHALFKQLRIALRKDAEQWQGRMIKRLSGKPLVSRSKILARSLGKKVSGSSLGTLQSRKFSTEIAGNYNVLQEFGTRGAGGFLPDIVSRRGAKGWLAQPVGKALTAAGVPRLGSPIDYGDFLSFRESRNRPIRGSDRDIAFLVPEGGTIKDAYYILRKKVAIPPRLGFFETHEKQAAQRRRRFAVALSRAVASV